MRPLLNGSEMARISCFPSRTKENNNTYFSMKGDENDTTNAPGAKYRSSEGSHEELRRRKKWVAPDSRSCRTPRD